MQIGVFQGDPLSVAIFNTVMCTLIEALHPLRHLGYNFSQSQRTIHLLQYADDTCLMGNGPASCQALLRSVEKWLQWTGMQAKVPKCHSLGVHASSGTSFDPCLSLNKQPIPFIGNMAIKFLGSTIQVPLDNTTIRNRLLSKLSQMLQRVDETPVTRNQKLRLYRAAICPRLNWDLTVNNVPLSWITRTMEATATRYLKRWSGLARSADPSRLYLPPSKGGLNLPSISLLYKKQQVSQACQLLVSADPTVRHTTTVEIRREEALQRGTHRPMLAARDLMAENPGSSKKALVTKAKATVTEDDARDRLQHAQSLECQGQVFRCTEEAAANIWSKTVQKLPPDLLKFSLNTVQDTLPHNANLAKWRKKESLSSACRLCGEKQTLLHVLNHCPQALSMRRFNTRHDAVLEVIASFIAQHLPESYKVTADLPRYQPYVFPLHIATTDQRPDIVVWSDTVQEVWVIELTVCFETRYEEAHNLKVNRYADLMEQIDDSTYSGSLVTLEVGSRGFLSLPSFTLLKQQLLICTRRQWEQALSNITRTAISGSHRIWVTRNHKEP